MASFKQSKLKIEIDLVTGINFQLEEYLYFDSDEFGSLRTITDSDGISAPRIIENVIQRFGPYLASGIMHDAAFRGKLEKLQPDGTWTAYLIDMESACNRLIEEALKSEKCSWLEREVIYHMLQMFGWKAFDEDRKNMNKPTINDLQKLVKPNN